MFQEKFKEMAQECLGIDAITLIGEDGITVDQYIDEMIIFEELSIEFSELNNKIKDIFNRKDEELKEIVFIGSGHIYLINQITDFYILIVSLKATGNFGKARFIIRKNQPWFKNEIGV